LLQLVLSQRRANTFDELRVKFPLPSQELFCRSVRHNESILKGGCGIEVSPRRR